MADRQKLKAERPIRFALAVTAYRLVWWPICAVLIPFAALGAFVDWLSWAAFPAVARAFQPSGAWMHDRCLALGDIVLGYNPKDELAKAQGGE